MATAHTLLSPPGAPDKPEGFAGQLNDAEDSCAFVLICLPASTKTDALVQGAALYTQVLALYEPRGKPHLECRLQVAC